MPFNVRSTIVLKPKTNTTKTVSYDGPEGKHSLFEHKLTFGQNVLWSTKRA